MAQAGLAERDQRRVDRLVRAAFGAERDPARRRDEQEARVLVASVIEAIEAAGDERIVERSDREQPRARTGRRRARPRRASGTGCSRRCPSSMCWPLLVARPFLRRRNLCLGENVGDFPAAEQAALVDPGAEIGRNGDVGRGGDDPVGEIAAGLADRSSRMRPNAAWVDCSSPAGAAMVGHVDRAEGAAALVAARCGCVRSAFRPPARALSPMPSSGSHSWPSRTPMASRSAAICVGFISPA